MCLSVSACFVRVQAPLKNGREEREADTIPSLHLLDRGFPPSPPLSPSGSPPLSLLPLPSLSRLGSLGFSRVSRYCLCLELGRGGEGGRRLFATRKKVSGFFFLPPFSTIWPQFLRHQRPLGGPADFPLVNSHRQEETRLLLVLYGFWFLFVFSFQKLDSPSVSRAAYKRPMKGTWR